MDIKCSAKKHTDNNAICYCYNCKKYLCNKCQNYHSELFEDHQLFNVDKNTNLENLFTGYCKEKNHSCKFEYFCKSHNKLCCAECIIKIKDEIKGQHHDCDVCKIENIAEEKRNKLKENIKCLEELNKSLENSINELKKIIEKKNEEKEKLKLEMQNIFTKIRNALNEKEDELLIQIDKEYDKLFINDNFIKESEKYPNKVNNSLEKGKSIDKEWNNNKLILMINDCINIENNISDINKLNENIKKCYSNDKKEFEFSISEIEVNNFLVNIKEFGKIACNKTFKWKSGKNYSLSNNDLIATKTNGGSSFNCNILGDIILPKNKINKWKIKLRKYSYSNIYDWNILIGVGPSNINQNDENLYNKTWTLICGSLNVSINSGSQTKYKENKGKLKEGDIIEVIMNTINGELSFSINGENYGVACKIELDISLSPFVLINFEGQSIELLNQ